MLQHEMVIDIIMDKHETVTYVDTCEILLSASGILNEHRELYKKHDIDLDMIESYGNVLIEYELTSMICIDTQYMNIMMEMEMNMM